jgi:hypothetical protein
MRADFFKHLSALKTPAETQDSEVSSAPALHIIPARVGSGMASLPAPQFKGAINKTYNRLRLHMPEMAARKIVASAKAGEARGNATAAIKVLKNRIDYGRVNDEYWGKLSAEIHDTQGLDGYNLLESAARKLAENYHGAHAVCLDGGKNFTEAVILYAQSAKIAVKKIRDSEWEYFQSEIQGQISLIISAGNYDGVEQDGNPQLPMPDKQEIADRALRAMVSSVVVALCLVPDDGFENNENPIKNISNKLIDIITDSCKTTLGMVDADEASTSWFDINKLGVCSDEAIKKELDALDFAAVIRIVMGRVMQTRNYTDHEKELMVIHCQRNICNMQMSNIKHYNPVLITPIGDHLNFDLFNKAMNELHVPRAASHLIAATAGDSTSALAPKAQAALRDPIKLAQVLVDIFPQILNDDDPTHRQLDLDDLHPVFERLGL